MKKLYILYDSECELCRRCRVWLGQQPAFVPLVFVPFQSAEAACRFPALKELHPEEEIVVIDDRGAVWQGGAAWVMCLWALREYREWSLRLGQPVLLGAARRLCTVIASNRHKISTWLREASSGEELERKLALIPDQPPCAPGGYCRPR